MTSKLSAVLPDLSPWRSSRDFRLLWVQGLIAYFGSFMAMIALPLQIKDLTESPLAVGAMGAVELVPLIVFGLYGGALADAGDRRKLIVRTELGLAVLAGLLLVNAMLPEPMLWPLYVVAAGVSAMAGLQRPAIDSLMARIVPHDQLTAAAALNNLRWQFGGLAGPAAAGLVVAWSGHATAYAMTIVTFGVSALLCLRLAPAPAVEGAEKPSLRGIVEGARYAWSRPVLLGTYAIDLVAMFFAFPVAIFPFLADDLDAEWSLGLMFSAIAGGSLLLSLMSGWTSRVRRHGLLVVFGAGIWGLAIAAAGWFDSIWLVLLALAVAGAGDTLSGLGRMTIWNQTIPEELRGRLAGIEVLSYSVGPQLGQVRSGAMAGWTGTRAAIWSGGVLCVAGVALLAAALPRLLRYDSATDEDALRRKAQQEAALAKAADGGAAGAAPGPAAAGRPAAG
ncbi:MFS transporter [Streptomyces clavuligerus]|uniref:Putative permease of the major facilitator superfamily n=1 Tax=Streptomyces clavuligerus TaxID=1901 RepID=E2Q1U1_STRCL|nr:MFS transporter [Streptomyces clavuligerus]ANW20459.1 MFS transporter [Streptomyces clavuligerus]AXU15085.1 MFS transporter [Streptomyces clavuligerus]EFG06567.1 Putative permease of the major facilitator superfamily [Streptomyces clavuligerus]MBY6305144.1 MFS transporter [Streptomyces clavuligerus]QCS07859.1 MFS transporter [Streptomyces clavuligerus]